MSEFNTDDIRSAVAAGILDEAKAASLIAHAQTRHDYRTGMQVDEEPFEFFKGFSEIFVAIGISLLGAGIVGLSAIAGGFMAGGIFGMITAFAFANYFTLKRRMSLPSIILAIGFAISSSMVMGTVFEERLMTISLGNLFFLAIYFRVFKVPFTVFLMGLNGFFLLLSAFGAENSFSIFSSFTSLDLLNSGTFAWVSLLFGVVMMIVGLYFDMKDPHRLGRYAQSGFWAHVLAAPAIVNTCASTVFNMEGATGYLLTAFVLLIVTLFALIIDRRSFLTAGLGYFIAILAWAMTEAFGDEASGFLIIFVVGAFFTLIGTFWTQIRTRVMTALPAFPGKSKLPPYGAV
jgi:hypothetical protein